MTTVGEEDPHMGAGSLLCIFLGSRDGFQEGMLSLQPSLKPVTASLPFPASSEIGHFLDFMRGTQNSSMLLGQNSFHKTFSRPQEIG